MYRMAKHTHKARLRRKGNHIHNPSKIPLGEQILNTEGKLRQKNKVKSKKCRNVNIVNKKNIHSDYNAVESDESDTGGTLINKSRAKKLLEEISRQQYEIIDEDNNTDKYEEIENNNDGLINRLEQESDIDELHPTTTEYKFELDDDDDDNEDGKYVFDEDISELDRQALEMFLPENSQNKQITLGDIIIERQRERQKDIELGIIQKDPGNIQPVSTIDSKVIYVYKQVGIYLHNYKSGKIPKPFKIIPSLKNWEEILYYTQPNKWTSQAMYSATKLFSANLNPLMAQRFYNLVLLPHIMDDIDKNKKCNFHLYQALCRSLFKPTAFFKGIILPLAQIGCKARQSIIFASVLSKCSIPVSHAAVALLKLSEVCMIYLLICLYTYTYIYLYIIYTQIPYNGTQILFLKTLINKKYSQPLQVITALCNFFIGLTNDERNFPVLLYQALLGFVQKYHEHLIPSQRSGLLLFNKKKPHTTISQDIHRILLSIDSNSMIDIVQ